MGDLELLEFLTFFLVLVSNVTFLRIIIKNRHLGKLIATFFGLATAKGGASIYLLVAIDLI